MRFIYFILLSVIAALGHAVSAYAEPPSAYEFMKPSTHSGMVISPSGRYLAFKQVKTDRHCLDKYGQMEEKEKKCKDKNKAYRSIYYVAIFDLQESKVEKVLPIPENYFVGWLDFASDDRLLASMGTRTTIGSGGRRWFAGGSRVVSIPVLQTEEEGGGLAVLFDSEKRVQRSNRQLTGVTNMLRDDPNHVVMPAVKGGDLDLWKVNVVNGHAEQIATGKTGTFYWYTNKQGKPLLRYDCSGRKCRKLKVYAPNSNTGEWEKIREVKVKDDEDFKDSAFFPAALTDNDNEVIILSEEDEDERRSVKVYDLEKQAYTRTLYEHPKYDVGGVLTSTSTGEYMGAWLVEDRLKYYIKNPRFQKHYDAINKYFDDEANVSLIGYDKAGTKSVVFVSSHNHSGGYYIYDFAAQSIKRLLLTEPKISENIASDGRIIQIPMRDGTSITAYHYYPKGQQSGLPLLVMPHGGPHLRDSFGFDYWVQYFVSRGYQVVQMNFRGSSGYGRDFKEAGYGEWGGLMQDDITDTTKYFQKNGLATPAKTCIVGYSFGGYSALYGGATTPELYSCVVSGGGISNLNRMLKDDKGNLSDEGYEHMKETLALGDPKGSKDMLEARSPINLVDNYQAPVLLIHGEWDSRVEVHHSEKMYKALKKAGKDVTYLELEEEGHQNWDLETDIQYLQTVEQFLDQHIGQ